MKPKYYVTTWDTKKQEFTAQAGVKSGPYTLFGLRKAIRKLRSMGYPADTLGNAWDGRSGDPSVLVERKDSC